ncbi:hypothetical protein [Truepera radiovictrix]|uniref:hypothetical protein n=1 Tax=Truepera radiovictrix TaxID=332249 RepID=UPI00030480F0|nr:hypothetical protein [Truepera radiovictrix]WMT57901.1 hypothetical protein RCV51_02875 [Truepera radiovictrix]
MSDRLSVLATQSCVGTARATERVAPGVTLHYDNAFFCSDAPVRERYTFTVRVTNPASSTVSATLQGLELRLSTPRPRGRGPEVTGAASGLPLTLAPGESGSFVVSGLYELVRTDEGGKANAHFHVRGGAGNPFHLGLNAHFRGASGREAAPPAGRPGGPPRRPGPPPRPGPG